MAQILLLTRLGKRAFEKEPVLGTREAVSLVGISVRRKTITAFAAGLFGVCSVGFYPASALAENKKDSRAQAAPSHPAATSQWSIKMKELFKTLAELLTDVSSDSRYRNSNFNVRIDREAQRLAALARDLNQKGVEAPDGDPTLQIIAGMLGRETKRAVTELKRGNRTYARTVLRSIPNYCIACHTRNSSGPQFSKLPFEPTSDSLTVFEKGEFFAASRQFERAQTEFKKVIEDQKSVDRNLWTWSRAVHESLAIAVRVKKDPTQAAEIIETLLRMPHAPSSLKEDARIWKVSIQEWQAELPHQAVTEEGLYTEAVKLMARAREIQKYPMDRTADIIYLRASSAAHDLLQQFPLGTHSNDALLLAGLSYEVLGPLKTENLHEMYYEACVRKTPHTLTAEICFRRYEESMVLGYTGSAGTDIPDDATQGLAELRSLSQPLNNIQK